MAGPAALTLRLPDDLHLHLRDGAALADTVAASARAFGRVMVMPNLAPPVTTLAAAEAYRARVLAALPAGAALTPLMTLYLTDDTDPAALVAAAASGVIAGVKLYPANATTNSGHGVTSMAAVDDCLAALAEVGLPLLVHGEVTDAGVDVFDRELRFLGDVLGPLLARHPALRVVLEHVTSAAGVRFVEQARAGVGATITAHHLRFDRNDLLVGGVRPHRYCLPVPKRRSDRAALLAAATSGSPRFFLGTDSAPHARAAKEAACGCAGCYTAPFALALYAEAFEEAEALERLDDFGGRFGAEFYGLPLNTRQIALRREAGRVPDRLPLGGAEVVPLCAGETLRWRLALD
jgi:dihydroorotase